MLIGIVGGTGPAGRSLALRLSSLGHDILLGSRDQIKAQDVVSVLAPQGELSGLVQGVSNIEAATGEVVFLATPWEGAQITAKSLATELTGKVVVSMVNGIIKVGNEMQPVLLARGSVAQSVQAVLPGCYVVSALHHVPARELGAIGEEVVADVLVCSDHEQAKDTVIALLGTITGLRPLDGGSLANSGAIEAMTAVLINLNIRYKARTAIRITGLEKR